MREYNLDALLANISMVFQSVYLFRDTIENNIKSGNPVATRQEVIAKQAVGWKVGSGRTKINGPKEMSNDKLR